MTAKLRRMAIVLRLLGAAAQGAWGAAGMTDEELERLREGFDTRRLLAAVDDLDLLRSRLADDGRKPPELRDHLLKLHGLAMKVINSGSREAAGELFDLAGDLDLEVFEILEAATRLQETLEALTDLRPPSLDEGY